MEKGYVLRARSIELIDDRSSYLYACLDAFPLTCA
jgi:hypothetical protein